MYGSTDPTCMHHCTTNAKDATSSRACAVHYAHVSRRQVAVVPGLRAIWPRRTNGGRETGAWEQREGDENATSPCTTGVGTTRDEAEVSTLPIQNEYELVGSATYGRVVVYSKRAWVCKMRQGNNEHDADGEEQHKPDSYDSPGASQCSDSDSEYSNRPTPTNDQPGKNTAARASNKQQPRTLRTKATKKRPNDMWTARIPFKPWE